jgi:anti-sigma factor RsiW
MNELTQSTEHLTPEQLNAYIDGELPPASQHFNQQGIAQHLATCHACTLRVLSATQLKAATARAGQRFAPPPDALARLTAKLHAQQQSEQQPQLQLQPKRTARIFTMRSAAWSALAAALVLTISLMGWRQINQSNALSAELASEFLDQHLATLSAASTPQVISTDRHTVKPWFQGRLPFSFNLPEPDALPPDTALKGADLAYLDGKPAAQLLFTIHKHQVSVFLTQRSAGPSLAKLPQAREGFTLHTATTPDLQIIAVSDVNPAELDALVAVLVHAQTPAQAP